MFDRLRRWSAPAVLLVAGCGIYRILLSTVVPPEPATTVTNAEPNAIVPVNREDRIATDEQLRQILPRVIPDDKPTTSNHWLHALRLWGPTAKFPGHQVTGVQMLGFFTDDQVFRRFAGKTAPPLFVVTDGNIQARSFDDNWHARTMSSYHSDDILATFAESGLPLDYKLQTRAGEVTVGQLMEASMGAFHLQRHEYEWSVISYGRYWFPRKRWTNKYGEIIRREDLIRELVSHPLPLGPCNGLHRLEAAIVLYRANELQRLQGTDEKLLLTKREVATLVLYMKTVVDQLIRAQAEDGHWHRRWYLGEKAKETKNASLSDKILVTGHHLEWLAFAPPEILPPRENIVRAGQYLARTLIGLDQQKIVKHYGPLSHSVRALCLWRGSEAFSTYKRLLESQPVSPTKIESSPQLDKSGDQ